MKAKQKPRPQTTIVHVAVTTDGPVPMKAIREWVAAEMRNPLLEVLDFNKHPPKAYLEDDEESSWSWPYAPRKGYPQVTAVWVKRDADVQKPRG